MPTLTELGNAIDELLGHPLGAGYFELVHHVEEKAYEAYIFGLCLRAVRELGVTPVLTGINGTPNPFVFRGAPGQIHSQSRNYGFAAFTLNGHDFEIHAGVEFKGTSEMTHELDIAIMRANDAANCRRFPDDPPAASLVAGWECKFYSGNLSKALGRQFVGLVKDLGTNMRVDGICSNVSSPQLRLFLRAKDRPYAHFDLTPLDASNETIFVNQLKIELKKLTAR